MARTRHAKPASVVTLRARWEGDPPQPGMLLAAPKGRIVYQVLGVVRTRTAGDPASAAFRLSCARLARSEVPEGATVHPWRWDARAPRQRRRLASRPAADTEPQEPPGAMIDRIKAKAPLMYAMALAANRNVRRMEEMAQLAQAARVGRDDGLRDGRDYGPGLRLRPARGRAADVELEDAADPSRPNVTARRARRSDPLLALFRAGTVTGRQVDAAERLRDALEAAQPSIRVTGAQSSGHLPPHERIAMSDRQINARTTVRQAIAAVGFANRPVLVWVTLGGTISGYAPLAHVGHSRAAVQLQAALVKLADHFFGQVARDTAEIRSCSMEAA